MSSRFDKGLGRMEAELAEQVSRSASLVPALHEAGAEQALVDTAVELNATLAAAYTTAIELRRVTNRDGLV